MIIDTIISIGLALAVAYVRGSLTDRAVMIVCTVGLSISILVYIIVFQYVFAYKLGWFPVQGWGDSFWENLFVYSSLPILIGLVVSIAPEPAAVPHIRARRDQPGLRAHGAREGRLREPDHVDPRAAQCVDPDHHEPDGRHCRDCCSASFLIERFFSIPGIGREVILAVERSDFPVIKAITVYVAFATIATNLLADLTYKAVDPRVQLK